MTPAAGTPWSPSDLSSPSAVAAKLAPAASARLSAAIPEILARANVGPVKRLALRETLHELAAPDVMPVVLRAAVEALLGEFGPVVAPWAAWALAVLSSCPLDAGPAPEFARAFADLLHAPRARPFTTPTPDPEPPADGHDPAGPALA